MADNKNPFPNPIWISLVPIFIGMTYLFFTP